jgi:hypothetical protein
MNTRTLRCSNCLPTQHSPEPVWISFAMSCKTVDDCADGQRRMWCIKARSRSLRGISVGLFALVTVSNRAVVHQIPIAL